MKTSVLILFFTSLVNLTLCAQEDQWFQKGLEARDRSEKIEFFTKSIQEESDPAAAYFCRAAAKLESGDAMGAIDDYTRCIELDPNDAAAYFNRGMARKNDAASTAGRAADLRKAFEIDPLNPAYINAVNEQYLKNQDYPNALLFYAVVLEYNPENRIITGNMGYCQLAMGNYIAARECFERSIALQPDGIDAILGMALVFYYLDDRVNAKRHIEEAMKLRPGLREGPAGFKSFKKEGYIYSDKAEEALSQMLAEWK